MKRLLRILAIVAALLIAAFLLLRTPDTDPAAMIAKYGGPPSQVIRLADGQRIHLRDEGPRDAPVIMLLHGSNADLHTWQPWVEGLLRDYRVIRYDQIGHGLTGPARDGDYTTDAFARDVGEVADALGLERFVLAGNSMGGAVAVRYAMLDPQRLAGLVLVDAGGAPMRREGGGNLGFAIAATPGINRLAGEITPRWLVERSLSQSVSNQAVVTPEAVDRYWELARYPGNRDAMLARFGLRRTAFTPAQVRGISVPTLAMWGQEDALIPYDAAGWYMSHLPDATLASYPGIGHLPMEEAPERTVADLRGWLAERAIFGPAR
ncbi:alpha/beta hydrolase [Leptolyngbya sp. 15MV]|nr:alpha/beta hydrolase [Leptolyngbya sp. 15MV]